MKTPWRFVADLVSRKPKADASEARVVAHDLKALPYQPTSEERHPEIEATVVDPSDPVVAGTVADNGPEPIVEQSVTPSPESVEAALIPASSEADEDVSHTATPSANAPVEAVPVRRKTIESTVAPAEPDRQIADEAPIVATVPKSVTDDMVGLDVEIEELRRQLAKKLTEQNAQMRRMLARFDLH
jgi:hypothetical protein